MLTIDPGHFMAWPAMYLDVPDAAGFGFNQSFQSIGLGLGAAIGAAVARPDRLALAVVGDGGAMMALGELETAASLGEPLLVVVQRRRVRRGDPPLRPHGSPRRPGALRTPGPRRVRTRRGRAWHHGPSAADLDALDEWLAAPAGLCVVDARITPTVVADWLEEAFRTH